MLAPSPEYLAAIQAGLDPTTGAPAAIPGDPTTAPPVPVDAVTGAPTAYGSGPAPTGAQLFGTQQQQADAAFDAAAKGAASVPPAAPYGSGGRLAAAGARAVAATANQTAAAAPPPVEGAGQPSQVPYDMALRRTAGTPARDVEMRSKPLLKQQAKTHATEETAAKASAERTEAVAEEDLALATKHAMEADQRRQEAEDEEVRRKFELAERQADFQMSSQALAKAGQTDPGRWWASRTSGEKIGATVSLFLGGFLQGFRGGGPNPALEIINRYIDQDIRAQELAYQAAKDEVAAKNTAFGMAMQKYGSAEAARAATRTAALDIVAAEARGIAAKYKGVDAQNLADEIQGRIEEAKSKEVERGVMHVQAQGGGVQAVDLRTGLPLTNAQALARANEVDKMNEDRRTQATGIAGKLLEKGAEQQQKQQGLEVTLPGAYDPETKKMRPGMTIRASSEQQANKLRTTAEAVSNANQLVERAIQIRNETGWRLSPAKRAEMKNIQAELTTAFKDRAGLGALSGPDMDLAQSATGNLFSLTPGTDAQLRSFQSRTNASLQNQVATIPKSQSPNAQEAAAGKMPGSYTEHGGK